MRDAWSSVAAAERERPIFVEVDGGWLFGVESEPDVPVDDRSVLLVWGTELGGAGRNRVWARLARRLASDGHAAFRFDPQGNGESSGGVAPVRVANLPLDDVVHAAADLRARHGGPVALVGHCAGARALVDAVPRIPDLWAVVLVSPPLLARRSVAATAQHWSVEFVRNRLKNPRTWARLRYRGTVGRYIRLAFAIVWGRVKALGRRVTGRPTPSRAMQRARQPDRAFVAGLEDLAARAVPVLLLYGDEEPDYEDLRSMSAGPFARAVRASNVTMRILPGYLHGMSTRATQDRCIDVVAEWLRSQ